MALGACTKAHDHAGDAGVPGVGLPPPRREDDRGVFCSTVHGLDQLVPLVHELLGAGAGDGRVGFRARDWGVRHMDGHR